MRYGFILPGGDVWTIPEMAAEAEVAGWDGVFIPDSISIDTPIIRLVPGMIPGFCWPSWRRVLSALYWPDVGCYLAAATLETGPRNDDSRPSFSWQNSVAGWLGGSGR